MTGYGRGAAERGGRRATVEIRAVNHRFLDVKLRGAQVDGATEEQLVGKIREALDRGAITATIHLERRGPAAVRYDADAARAAHAALAALAQQLGTAPPDLALVVAQPGVVVTASDDDDGAVTEAVVAAADDALAGLLAMRAAEGDALAKDLEARLANLAGHVDGIKTRSATQAPEARRRLDERLKKLLDASGTIELDPGRVAQEIAILADKLDITEELVRTHSHLSQMRALINAAHKDKSGIGRRLDFLVQELGRELNTMGAKSAAPEIIDLVVRSKAELEKVREQVQNVE
ncbi:MAG TPA: YicC/YloC family endoribonuclease [Kofleriaceae bacterium]|nr:YicC/YloC family endoribonuclease [Kofleriaceae bacterium]